MSKHSSVFILKTYIIKKRDFVLVGLKIQKLKIFSPYIKNDIIFKHIPKGGPYAR